MSLSKNLESHLTVLVLEAVDVYLSEKKTLWLLEKFHFFKFCSSTQIAELISRTVKILILKLLGLIRDYLDFFYE